MIRIAKPTDPKKLAELKRNINSLGYLDRAVSGLADTLTHGMLKWNGMDLEKHDSKQQRKH